MELKKVNNALYKTTLDVGAGKFKQVFWYALNVCFFKNPFVVSSSLKVWLLRLFGAEIGQGVIIKPSVNIKFPWKLTIGNNSWIGESVWLDNLSTVIIGSSVTISQGALILTGSHDYTKTSFDFLSSSIYIEDGVWIGAKSVVCGGITCRTHSVLGLNAVAQSELKAYTVYMGNPAVPVLSRRIVS